MRCIGEVSASSCLTGGARRKAGVGWRSCWMCLALAWLRRPPLSLIASGVFGTCLVVLAVLVLRGADCCRRGGASEGISHWETAGNVLHLHKAIAKTAAAVPHTATRPARRRGHGRLRGRYDERPRRGWA